ncbi:MAG: malate dehydrogenase, partial [Chloroflexota bacterium]
SQSAPIEGFPATIRGTTDYAAMAGSRLVIVTAGLARKPGMSRDDLLSANANIVGPIAEQIARTAPNAIVIVVTHPLDVMVALALQRSGFPRERVMGMAGVLDSARLRTFLSERLGVAPREIQAMVLGSHGDLMVPMLSSLTAKGEPVTKQMSAEELDCILQRTKDGGAEVVALLKQGSAFYAPASGVVEMASAILRNTHAVLPACAWLQGEYGLRDVAIGVPVQLGSAGIERIVDLPLTSSERAALTKAAEQVREMTKSLATLHALPARSA